MSKKLIRMVQLDDAPTTCRIVKVFYVYDTDEYLCELHINGGHYEPADYFTDDRTDAFGTANAMCKATK